MRRGGKRGGGGYGGKFSSSIGEWARERVERRGPITEERPLYPPSACDCTPAPALQPDAATLVLMRRLMTNYWRSSECFVSIRPTHGGEQSQQALGETADVVTYANAFDQGPVSYLEHQKECIVSLCGKQYFPAELLQTKLLLRPSRAQGRGAAGEDSRRRRLREMEQKETESKGAEEKQKTQSGTAEEKNEDEQEDFGGDDYAHDYYADEDLDDHLDEGDEGGVFGGS